MKILQKIMIVLFTSALVIGCSKSGGSGDCSACAYTKVSGETDATTATSLHGEYQLTMHYASTNSPFPDGTKATFTISEKELIVAVEGKDCITLQNPVFMQAGATEVVFKDTCNENIMYGVSITSTGKLNEINIATISGTWLGQFNDK